MDARGSSSGVIYSKLSSYKWSHWGIPEGLYEESEVLPVLYEAKVIASSGSTVNMREKASTSSNRIRAIKIGEVVDVIEEDGEWSKIVYNGSTGYMMNKFLEKLSTNTSSSYYVKINCGSEEDARTIALALKLCGQTSIEVVS